MIIFHLSRGDYNRGFLGDEPIYKRLVADSRYKLTAIKINMSKKQLETARHCYFLDYYNVQKRLEKVNNQINNATIDEAGELINLRARLTYKLDAIYNRIIRNADEKSKIYDYKFMK